MDNIPHISIVIPTFNGSRYIREAIDSICNQTFSSWEVIVVDDGSTDGTPGIVQEFMAKEPRVRLIQHEKNRQLPSALNTGFAEAKGSYLTWTADDNLFRPTALEVLSRYLASHPHVGLVYAAATVIDANGQVIRHRPAANPHDLYERNPVGWCFMYTAKVRQQVGDYDPACFLAEDIDYWLRIAKKFPVVALKDDLFMYRAHAHSLTESKPLQCRRASAAVRFRHLPGLIWASRNEKARVMYELMSFFKMDRQYRRAVQALWRGFWQDPKYFSRRLRAKLLARG